MTNKVVLTDLANLQNDATATAAINANNAAITTAMQNTLSRDGTSPNTMGAVLDMNSYHILNLPQPFQAEEPLRFQDLSTFVGGGTISNIPTGGDTNNILVKNSSADFDVAWQSQGSIFVGQPLTRTNDTNVTVTLGGTPSSSVLNAVSLTLGWSGTLAATRGGFGSDISSSSGVPLFASGTPTFTSTSGTGNFVRVTSPTMVTPVLGAATATSINGLTITSSTGTFTLTNGKTLEVDNTLTFTGTDSSSVAFGTGGTVTYTANNLSVFAATTSSQLAGIISDETGSGALVFATSPTLVTPVLGVASATTVNKLTITTPATGSTLTIADGKTLTFSNTLTLNGTDSTTFTFPGSSDTVVGLSASQTLTNKTLTSPTISGGTIGGITSFGIRSSGSGAFDVTIFNVENLTAGRTLTLTLNNVARTIDLSGNLTLAASFTTSGSSALTLTTTGVTNITLPTTGTLAVINAAQTFSSANIFSALTQFTDIKLSSGRIYPTADSTTALEFVKADGTTAVLKVDTTNARIGINKTPGSYDLDVNGATNVGGILTFGTLSATSLGASTSTITGLTVNNSPTASDDYLAYYSAADGAIRKATVASIAASATAGVSSLNGLTGGLSIAQGSGISVSAGGSSVTVGLSDAQLTSNIVQNSKSAAYTTVLTDGEKHILHPSADTTARTFTIDSNANVAYPIGTAITFVNQNSAGTVTIAITSDTMRLAGPGTTGSRTLAANGIATALKIATTEWIISGTGLT